jgi:hypothetical protein
MAKTVYVVFDNDLEKVAGVFDNAEAADECENYSPGDRYTIAMDLLKVYDEDDDIRAIVDDTDDDSVRVRVPRDDDDDVDEFIVPDEDDDRDPYGD